MVGYRAVRAVQEQREDNDILVQLDLIPQTPTDRLEALLSRSQALLMQCDPTSALGTYAKRQQDAIASELATRRPTKACSKRLAVGGPPVVVCGGDGGLNARAKRLAEKRASRASALSEAEKLVKIREERRQAAIDRLKMRQQRRTKRKSQRQPRRSPHSSESESVSDSDDSSTEALVSRHCEIVQFDGTMDNKQIKAATAATSIDIDDDITVDSGAFTNEPGALFCSDDRTRPQSPSAIKESCEHDDHPQLQFLIQDITEHRPPLHSATNIPDEPAAVKPTAEVELSMHGDLTPFQSATEDSPIHDILSRHDDDGMSEHVESPRREDERALLPSDSLASEAPPVPDDEKSHPVVLSQQSDEGAAPTQQSPPSRDSMENHPPLGEEGIAVCDEATALSSTVKRIPGESEISNVGSKGRQDDEDNVTILQLDSSTATEVDSHSTEVDSKEEIGQPKLSMTDYSGTHSTWWSIFSQWATWARTNKKHGVRNPPPGDIRLAMNRQWRLYTVYESVMADYATVFSSWTKSRVVYDGNSSALHFRVNSSRPEVFDIVTHVLTSDPAFVDLERWIELPSNLGLKTTWNLLWTWSKPRIDYSHLLSWQRVNHYPNSRHLTRKDLLARSLARMATLVQVAPEATSIKYKGAFDVSPATFLLPQDYCLLMKEFQNSFWIMKPVGLSRGRGISLVSDVEDLTYADPVVVQKYIERPLLLDSHKFDLRLYVLVTSFAPLEAFIYRDGFARVATRPFSLNVVSDKLVHLTNASIQKRVGEMPLPLRSATAQEAGGTKCSLEYLWRRLKQQHPEFNHERTWREICLVVLKSLVCVEDNIAHQPNSFEVFGYDIILDANCRPWLLEVNASPSMARESRLDAMIKEAMIRDTVRLVSPIRYDRTKLVEILDRRLREMEGALTLYPTSPDKGKVNADLNKILSGGRPRPYGHTPERPGAYEMIAPGPLHEQVRRMKRALVAPRSQ